MALLGMVLYMCMGGNKLKRKTVMDFAIIVPEIMAMNGGSQEGSYKKKQ